MATLAYPSEIFNETIPVVTFAAHPSTGDGGGPLSIIHFPCPGNITSNDSATFGSKDLGAAALGTEAAGRVMGGEGLSGMKDDMVQGGVGGASVGVGVLLADKLAGKYADVKYAKKIISNPNTVTTFTANGVRSFSYAFKFIPKSLPESNELRDVIDTFKRNIYAGTENTSGVSFFLKYPPVWTIKYAVGEAMDENPYIPRIFTCFLTAINTSFNGAAGGTYYSNGAPLEVDLSLTFQETRALFRQDIEDLSDFGKTLNVKAGAPVFE